MIEFEGVRKVFRDGSGREVPAVEQLDLVVADGETHCLLGTSGCGKTTCLRLVNRLENPTAGRVLVGGQDVVECDVYQLRRRIGYVIQSGGLFPHLSVADNIGLLCELEGWSAERREARVAELLELVNLPASEFRDRYPGQLSGGQAQRVGVARALALDPDYILMDEPFGALDPITRAQIHGEFEELRRTVRKTVLLVTHDLSEAVRLADRISIMDCGRIVQTGTADELVAAPASSFVADFFAAFSGGAT